MKSSVMLLTQLFFELVVIITLTKSVSSYANLELERFLSYHNS